MTVSSQFKLTSAISVLLWTCLSFSVHAQSATSAVRAVVFKPLQAAQEALKNNQVQQAMTLAKEALSVPQLSAYELVSVQRTLAVAAFNANDHAQASASLLVLLAQPDLSVTDQRIFLESLIEARLQLKDHQGVEKWARQYLAVEGAKPAIRLVLLQSLSAQNANEEVVVQAQAWLIQDAAGGVKISEAELRTLAVSYRNLKDQVGYETTLLRLLERHPSKEYWAEAITRQAQKPNVNPRLEFDMYRLLEETDNLDDAAEHVEMAELALKAGLPADAQRVFNAGFAKGILGQGLQSVAHHKLRQQIQAKVAEDEKLIDALEHAANDGNSWAAVGDVRLSQQQWALAKTAYGKALVAGGLRREAEVLLHHAIALFKSGDPEQCRKTLRAIKDEKTAVALANLWRIRTLPY